MLDDFIFCGRDIAELGACAAFGDSMTAGTEVDRMAYDLPGGGSIIMGYGTRRAIVRNVAIMPRDGVAGDAAWVRQVTRWLMQGRGRLVVKHDPDVFRLAQFDAAATYGAKIWPTGGLQMRMTLLPMAFAQAAAHAQGRTQSGKIELRLAMDTAERAPLETEIVCASGTITAAEITAGGRTLALSGFNLTAGTRVRVRCADTLLGELAEVRVGDALRFDAVKTWAQLDAANGEAIGIAVTGGEAEVRIAARGRFYA